MKLKKIASLALAGIMAVSMLAACGEGTNNGNSGSSSSQPTTASVVSTVKNAIADKNSDLVITVEENTALNDAMKKYNEDNGRLYPELSENDVRTNVLDKVFTDATFYAGNNMLGADVLSDLVDNLAKKTLRAIAMQSFPMALALRLILCVPWQQMKLLKV